MTQFDWKGARLKAFLKKREISVKSAADALGVSRQTVYQYFNSEQLTRDVVNNIMKTFRTTENVVFDAIEIHGNGSVTQKLEFQAKGIEFGNLVNETGDLKNQFIDLKGGSILLVTPLIEGYSRVKLISQLTNDSLNSSDFPSQSIIIEKFQEGEFLSFRMVNNSMNDGTNQSIIDGSIVTGRKIDLSKERFFDHKGSDFVIVHKEGVLIKRVTDFDPETGLIRCYSLNPDKEMFPDLSINLDECILIFIIMNVSTNRRKC